MARYIDADFAPIYLNKIACEQIKRIPTADVEEVKHGEWIDTNSFDHLKTPIFECSVCQKEVADHYIKLHKYCLHCGAKMDGGKNESI